MLVNSQELQPSVQKEIGKAVAVGLSSESNGLFDVIPNIVADDFDLPQP